MAKVGIASVIARVLNPRVPVDVVAFDGSFAGAPDAVARLDIRDGTALSYMMTSPGELGLVRAYVTGHLQVHGDLYTALYALRGGGEIVSLRERMQLVRDLGLRHVRPVETPPEELIPQRRVLGAGALRHTRQRDRQAISHHYDVSNQFYSWVLGPSMSYTCAAFPKEDSSLEEAQWNKHDLIANKLGLKSGMRLLDVGCGWGGMVMHAAQEHGVRALGVTLSAQQAAWAKEAIADRGLGHLAEVRHLDYRDVPEDGFDAISSIGLTEHIGAKQLPAYFTTLRSKLRAHGRMLNHCITRPMTTIPAKPGKFIDRYVFPDGELEAVGQIVSVMQDNGLEVRHSENLREHYAMTLRDWCENLTDHWDKAVAEVGANRARVWLLYMAACRVAFDARIIELHQVLGVRTDDVGNAAMPLRPQWSN